MRRLQHPNIVKLKDVFVRPCQTGTLCLRSTGSGGSSTGSCSGACSALSGLSQGANKVHETRWKECVHEGVLMPLLYVVKYTSVRRSSAPAHLPGRLFFRGGKWVETSLDLYMVMEYCPLGDLFNLQVGGSNIGGGWGHTERWSGNVVGKCLMTMVGEHRPHIICYGDGRQFCFGI